MHISSFNLLWLTHAVIVQIVQWLVGKYNVKLKLMIFNDTVKWIHLCVYGLIKILNLIACVHLLDSLVNALGSVSKNLFSLTLSSCHWKFYLNKLYWSCFQLAFRSTYLCDIWPYVAYVNNYIFILFWGKEPAIVTFEVYSFTTNIML